MISCTSALCTLHESDQIRMPKGAEPAGGQIRDRRSNLASRTPYNSALDASRAVGGGLGSRWELKQSGACSRWGAGESGGDWSEERGLLYCAVPNCRSLERSRRGVASQRHNGPR